MPCTAGRECLGCSAASWMLHKSRVIKYTSQKSRVIGLQESTMVDMPVASIGVL